MTIKVSHLILYIDLEILALQQRYNITGAMPPHYSSASYAYAVQYRRYTYCRTLKGKLILVVKVKVTVKVKAKCSKICIFAHFSAN